MSTFAKQAELQDAEKIAAFLDHVGTEPEALALGAGGTLARDASEVRARIEQRAADGGTTFVAIMQRPRKKGGDKVVGLLELRRSGPPKAHGCAELTMMVDPECVDQHIEHELLRRAVTVAEDDQSIDVLMCFVGRDCAQASRLCGRFGLDATDADLAPIAVDGMSGSTPEAAHDAADGATVMLRGLHRAMHKEGAALFYLTDVLDALDSTNDRVSWIACRETGELRCLMDECCDEADEEDEEEEPLDSVEAVRTWLPLPDQFELNDWSTMCDFADLQDGELRNALVDTLHRRGAYGRFRDQCARHGLLLDYYALRDQHRRRIAIDWLEDNGCEWTEGRRPQTKDRYAEPA